MLTGLYRPMMGDSDVPYANPLFVAELMSDERFSAAGKDDPPAQAVASYSKVDENMYANFWGRMYQGIYRCNYLLASDGIIDWGGDEGGAVSAFSARHTSCAHSTTLTLSSSSSVYLCL